MRNRFIALCVAAAASSAILAAEPGMTQLEVEMSKKHGSYLTDSSGRALYLFTADRQGKGQQGPESNCYEACAQAWPPLLVQGQPQAGERVGASLIGTIQRRDGSTQVTYAGWPLYYFVKDKGAGEATGQDKHGFGGEWYLVTPGGTKVGE